MILAEIAQSLKGNQTSVHLLHCYSVTKRKPAESTSAFWILSRTIHKRTTPTGKGKWPILQLQSTESAPHGTSKSQLNCNCVGNQQQHAHGRIQKHVRKTKQHAQPKSREREFTGTQESIPPMRQGPDADCRAIIERQGSRAGASSKKRAALTR
jgi:hypothetical protein